LLNVNLLHLLNVCTSKCDFQLVNKEYWRGWSSS